MSVHYVNKEGRKRFCTVGTVTGAIAPFLIFLPVKRDYEMEMLETFICVSGDRDKKIHIMDTIYFSGEYWLVPEWVTDPCTRKRRPRRILCLADLKHQVAHGGHPVCCVTQPVTRDVLFAGSPRQKGIRGQDAPEVWDEIPCQCRWLDLSHVFLGYNLGTDPRIVH
jgi:hypothetical protein